MSFKLNFWRVEGKFISELFTQELDNEKRLENWIEDDPSILGENLLIIGRQVITESGGRIDLLALDENANTVVIELKKGKTPRDIIGQILDYASWVRDLTYSEIDALVEKYQGQNLLELFTSHFEQNPPDKVNQTHRMIIVASSLDESSERIIDYLSSEYDININATFFNFFKDGDREYVGRAWLLDPEQLQERIDSKATAPWTGYWFVNVGEGSTRNWDDNIKYGYIGAGQGRKYSDPLKKLEIGDKIFAYLKGSGYVGFGEVTLEATRIKDFEVKGKPLLDNQLVAEKPDWSSDDDNLSEYCVGVNWIKTRERDTALSFKGIFANQNIVCKLRDPKTLKFLKERFGIVEE